MKKLTKEYIEHYAGITKKEWIAWALREIREYQRFIKMLEKKR